MEGDRFRHRYRELTEQEKKAIDVIKDRAEGLANAIAFLPDSREKSIAMTKLEECVMWAVKGATAITKK